MPGQSIARLVEIVIAALVVALVVTSCSDDGGSTNAGDGDAGGGLQVVASGTSFDPESLPASSGDVAVSLVNEDGVSHTFTIED
jgi:hypothetical protein